MCLLQAYKHNGQEVTKGSFVFKPAECLVFVKFSERYTKAENMEPQLQVSPEWERIFGRLFLPEQNSEVEASSTDGISPVEARSTRIAVFGGNRVGKSTFNRWLINKFLESAELGQLNDVTSVIYVDLDPGQAEFTPPGVISVVRISEPVVGSNYSHLTVPVMSKYLGSLNMSDCARTYIRYCKEIADFLKNEPRFQGLPWVINTMGFSKGLGVTLACEVIALFAPNVVIEIRLSGVTGEDKRTYPFHLNSDQVRRYLRTVRPHVDGIGAETVTNYQFIHIDSVLSSFPEPVRKSIWSVPARELRDRVLISYFSSLTEQTDDNKITSVVPRIVSLDSVAIATMHSPDLSYDNILDAMNGSLVALCSVNSSDVNETPKMLVKAERFSNDFIGYGIVRAIGRVNKLLYIITPVPEELLVDQANCIVTAGNIGLPLSLYLQGLNQKEDGQLPYVEHKSRASSKLHESAKRQFMPNRVAHTALKNCLL